MKKIGLVFAFALMVMAVGLTSCKKYEEGPGLSLRSKKGRVAGTWKIEKATSTNSGVSQDVTSTFTALNYRVTFEKDGNYKASTTLIGVTTTESGKWEFLDGKDQIKTTSGNDSSTLDIVRLTNKEFWLKETDNGTTTELHFAAE